MTVDNSPARYPDKSNRAMSNRSLPKDIPALLDKSLNRRRWPSSLPSLPCACAQQARRQWPTMWACSEAHGAGKRRGPAGGAVLGEDFVERRTCGSLFVATGRVNEKRCEGMR